MLIDRPAQACGYVMDGEFVTFDSALCLLRRYESLAAQDRDAPVEIYFADQRDAALHRAETVTFLLTHHLPTVMDSGVVAFASRQAAEAARRHDDEVLTDWPGFQLARGVPDRVLEVTIGPAGMSPEIVQVDKGELVLWKLRGTGLEQDLVVSVAGYPEIEAVVLPASGDEVEFRLMALRPGAGFPIVRTDSGEALGMLKVTGAHTLDEEAM